MKNKVDYTLYLVTDRDLMSTATLEEAIEEAILGGCTLVQLREKDCSSIEFYNIALSAKAITDKHNIPLIINDRIDIALTIDAAGVHIGQNDLPAKVVRKIIGKNMILGVSASCLDEAAAAKRDGADYLGIGAMFATGTKTDAAIVSMDELNKIRAAIDIPIVVIGGINHQTIPQFYGTKIDGIAVVSAVISEPDIAYSAARIKDQFLQIPKGIGRRHQCNGAVFDLDGTLLDSMKVWEKIDIDFLSKRGFKVPDDFINAICSRSFKEAAEYVIDRFRLNDTVDDLINEWNNMAIYEYSHNIKLKPGAQSYLMKLKSSGIKMAIATGLPRMLFEPVLKNTGIYDLFDAFCSTDDVTRGKEFPDIFLLAAQKLGLSADDCILFEDIPQAIISGSKAGMTVYGVYDPSCKLYINQIKNIADGYIYDFTDAPIVYPT